MKKMSFVILILLSTGCGNDKADVQTFLDVHNDSYKKLYYESAEASWKTNTEIREGDTLNAYHSRIADEALAAFTGSVENIQMSKKFLAEKNDLEPIQVRQLEAILFNAGSDPQTVAPLVKEKIKASIAQTEKLFGFQFMLYGKSVTTNDLDEILREEKELNKRLKAWESSKEVGKELKEGLINLRRLRNETVQALDFPDFFSYQVSDYGL